MKFEKLTERYTDDDGNVSGLVSKHDRLWLLGGLVLGWFLSNFVHTFYSIQGVSDVIAGRIGGIVSCSTFNANVSVSTDEDRRERLWKYYESYRYTPAVRRFSYAPFPAKICGAAPSFESWFQQGVAMRSSHAEDKFIYETFFKGRPIASNQGGTYVELGAYNGAQESNTNFFDQCLGWKGLLIEGNPGNYQGTISNRPFAEKMSLAPSCSAEYEKVNKTIQFYAYPMTNTGLIGHAKTYDGKVTVDVPCGPLTPILEDVFHVNKTIDFFSLDVEGAEDLVLATIDFSKIRINVMMIEIQNNHCRNDSCEVRKKVRAKMASEGYRKYEGLVIASDIYVHPESPYQIAM